MKLLILLSLMLLSEAHSESINIKAGVDVGQTTDLSLKQQVTDLYFQGIFFKKNTSDLRLYNVKCTFSNCRILHFDINDKIKSQRDFHIQDFVLKSAVIKGDVVIVDLDQMKLMVNAKKLDFAVTDFSNNVKNEWILKK